MNFEYRTQGKSKTEDRIDFPDDRDLLLVTFTWCADDEFRLTTNTVRLLRSNRLQQDLHARHSDDTKEKLKYNTQRTI